MPNYEVKIITVPLCHKCKIMKKRLQKLQEKYPEIIIEEKGIHTYLNEALNRRIMDAPIILINNELYAGLVDESIIIQAIGL